MAMALSSRFSYHRRLFLWLFGYSCLMVGSFVAFQYHREKHFKAEELNSRLQVVNSIILEEISDTTGFDPVAALKLVSPSGVLRVSIIDLDGNVVYDNTLDSLPSSNHLDRSEIVSALRSGSGYTLRRHSQSTGGNYFYSATKGDGYIVRTAIPYSVSLSVLLKADYTFLWFMVAVASFMCVTGWFATRRMGDHISRLTKFAEKAERGERIYAEDPFPRDELGKIASHIVMLYVRLQDAANERDREHRRALHEQQEKDRIKKQLTNNINHELKTPVAAIKACLETLIDHPEISDEKRLDFLNRCLANTLRLTDLLTDIALLTRIDDGSSSIGKSRVDLSEIVADVCAECLPMAEAKDMAIRNEVNGELPMNGNCQLLSSIFRNLVVNAIAYSGGSEIEIRLTHVDNREISVVFADDGSGVEPEHLPRMFERFYRVDKGRSRREGGTGLGLAIVKNAVLFHNGSVSVENRRDGGLLFRMTFSRE